MLHFSSLRYLCLCGEPQDIFIAEQQQSEFPVTGMTCALCSSRVERALKKAPGVLSASINLASEQAAVTFAPEATSFEALKTTIERAGYGVIEPSNDEQMIEGWRRGRSTRLSASSSARSSPPGRWPLARPL